MSNVNHSYPNIRNSRGIMKAPDLPHYSLKGKHSQMIYLFKKVNNMFGKYFALSCHLRKELGTITPQPSINTAFL